MMSDERFILAEDSNGLFSIFDNKDLENEPLIYGARFGTEKIVDLLNELNDENKELKKENEKLREIITEMKDIIYMLQEAYVICEYSSEIGEDMQELKKAYEGNLEDFLKYFRED